MKRDSGFTIIEILAALVAGSLLVSLLAWTIAGLSGELVRARRDLPFAAVADAAPRLQTLIQSALPTAFGRPAFIGSATSMETDVTPPDALGNVGSVTMTLIVTDAADGKRLQAQFRPVEATIALPPNLEQPVALVSGMKDIRFSYIAHPKRDDATLPLLVTILFETPDGKHWPLSIEPLIAADGSCRFDPIAQTCRH